MDAFWGWHGTLGLSVVVVNALVGLLLIKARKESAPVPAVLKAVAYLGQALLLVQVLIGLDLWGHGARPSSSGVWSWLHMLLPIGALLFTVMLLVRMRKQPVREHAASLSKGAWHTASVAVVTYLIGLLA